MDKTYQLYISHSWSYNIEACKKKIQFFKQAGLRFQFLEAFNETPETSGNSKETYTHHLDAKIKASDCLLILAGTGEAQEYWTRKEIELAKIHRKPIIAIEPWLPVKTMPLLREKADVIVKWHGKLISDAIRSLA